MTEATKDMCDDLDTDPEGPGAFFWGLESPCTLPHEMPDLNFLTLNRVRWIQLGKDTRLRSCKEWLHPQLEPENYEVTCANWAVFLKNIDYTEEQTLQFGLRMKIPGLKAPLELENCFDWDGAMATVGRLLRTNCTMWCQSPPPVLLICNAEQAERCAARDWRDSVKLEASTMAREAVVVENNTDAAPPRIESFEESIPVAANQDHLEAILGEPIIENALYHSDVAREEEEDDEILRLTSWRSGLGDDQSMWDEACRFFRHDPNDTESGVKLPGFKLTTRGYQMVDAYKMLSVCRTDKLNGTFNCSKPGLGKTLEVLVAAGAIALAHMSRENYRKDPSAHWDQAMVDPNRGATCALDHPFGIECYCIRGGMTRRLCMAVRRDPQLVVAPAGVVKQWCKEWSKVMSSSVRLRNGELLPGPLLRMAWVENQNIKTVEKKHCTELSVHDFMAIPVVDGALPPARKMRRLVANRSAEKGSRDKDLYNYTLNKARNVGDTFRCVADVRPLTEDLIGRERLMLVCSSSVISQGSFDYLFRVQVEVRQLDRKRKQTLNLSRSFVPSAIYYDEWTEGKGKDTNIVHVLSDLCQPVDVDAKAQQRPLVALLSGTPMPRGPRSLVGVMPLVTNSSQVKRKVADLVTVYQKAHDNLTQWKANTTRSSKISKAPTESETLRS